MTLDQIALEVDDQIKWDGSFEQGMMRFAHALIATRIFRFIKRTRNMNLAIQNE